MSSAAAFVLNASAPESPKGFKTSVLNIGIKDSTKDFVCIFSEAPCSAAGVFTQSRFAGPSVMLSRANLANGNARAIVAISKNANVANGPAGEQDAVVIISGIAQTLGIPADEVVIASTGVIGRRYPMDKILPHLQTFAGSMAPANFLEASWAIMTTDTVEKCASVRMGDAVLVGIAKGVGMIEPNMATLLTFFATDAEIDKQDLDAVFRRVMDRTFNCLSIDSDTSTSDSAIILANGTAGKVDLDDFEAALEKIALYLVRRIARDGEGATKLLEVKIDKAVDYQQAKKVAKAIVNSPLVKTAIYGADPNWGRVAMAVGKCEEYRDITPEKTIIRFNGMEVYPKALGESDLAKLKQLLKKEEVAIHVTLHTGSAEATVWGCDLSPEYVHINGDYTT